MAARAAPPTPSSCSLRATRPAFLSALTLVARRQKADIADAAVTVDVGLNPNGAGGFQLSAAVHVELSGVDQATADELVATAHQVCPYSNATRGNIEASIDTLVA